MHKVEIKTDFSGKKAERAFARSLLQVSLNELMASVSDIGLSAAINILTTLLFLFLFKVLKTQPANDRVYFPKLYLKGLRKGGNKKLDRTVTKFFNLNYRAYLGIFDWCRPALRMSEEELIEHAGLDSAVFLRIFTLGLKMFIPIMLLGLLVLVPVNVADKQLVDASQAVTNTKALFYSDIDKLSMSNIADGSPRLWGPLIMSYVCTGWVCFLLYMEYKNVSAMRLGFRAAEENRPDQFTVLVRQVPPPRHGSISESIGQYFRTNHPDYYLTHQMAVDANKLAGIVKRKEKVQNWLDYEELKYSRNPERRPSLRTGCGGLWGERVDAITHYSAMVEQLKLEISAEREIVLASEDAIMPAAFVSFKTRWGAAVCAQTQQSRDPTAWLTEMAPEPRDVYWPNLAIPYGSLYIRRWLIAGATFLLVFFFMIPVAIVQSLANLDGLERRASWLRPVVERSWVKSFLQGFLPGLALKIFLLLLPHLLMLMSKIEGWLALSVLDRKAAAKMYYFMVVNVFFGSILAGSAFEQLQTLYKQPPSDIPTILGTAIPMKATFFITFIMVDGWAAVAGEVVRFKPLILYHLKNMFMVKTGRDREEAMAPGSAGFDEAFPQLELYFLMGIVYSVITPLIMPFIVLFFAFGYVVYRHQVINVYDQDYESAGAFWPHIHGRVVASLLLEQVVLIGLFASKKGPESTPFLIGLPIVTVFFHLYCKSRFEPAFRKYPLEDAMGKDTLDRGTPTDVDSSKKYFQEAYLHPVFKLDEGDNDEKENVETVTTQTETGWMEEVQDSVPLNQSPIRTSHIGTQTSFSRQTAAHKERHSVVDTGDSPSSSLMKFPPVVKTEHMTLSSTPQPAVLLLSRQPEGGQDADLVATKRHTHSQGAIGHDGTTLCSCAYCLL